MVWTKIKALFSGKWDKIAVIISIISLAISFALTIHSFDLTEQANRLTEKSLELQKMLSNFTSLIVVNPERGFLNVGGYYSNWTTSSNPYGYLNISLTVITPHYGILSIEEKNFSVVDYFGMLNPEKLNLTTVSYYSEYDTYERPVTMGVNPLDFRLNLKAKVYPNPQKLPANSENEFPIGVFFLEAKLFDPHTNQTFTKEFSTIIFVTIKTL